MGWILKDLSTRGLAVGQTGMRREWRGRLEVACVSYGSGMSLEKCSGGRVSTTCVCRRGILRVQGATPTSFHMLRATLVSQSA